MHGVLRCHPQRARAYSAATELNSILYYYYSHIICVISKLPAKTSKLPFYRENNWRRKKTRDVDNVDSCRIFRNCAWLLYIRNRITTHRRCKQNNGEFVMILPIQIEMKNMMMDRWMCVLRCSRSILFLYTTFYYK